LNRFIKDDAGKANVMGDRPNSGTNDRTNPPGSHDRANRENYGSGAGERQLGRFLDDVYNRKWIHSSLGYMTPAYVEQQWGEAKLSRAVAP
jgi:transposase InsO family protein